MQLVITLRKDVADRDEGKALYDVVKQKLEDRPDIKVTGHVTNHFELEEPES
ncbi:unnamed protein product [marine sediment metagenome]|uniref:Uncharacterized protein n=1 Tax=marine sediment metagenome TaxID=412755 RepID=X1V0M8_9ZZZZ